MAWPASANSSSASATRVIAYGDFVLASAYRHLGKGRIGNDARVYKLAEQPICSCSIVVFSLFMTFSFLPCSVMYIQP
jgi:hypothetical protein